MTRRSQSPSNRLIQPGDLYWLPKLNNPDPALLASLGMEEGCFGHPVLILGTPDMGGSFYACILTSLSNKPLLDYHVGYRANYLPIHPAPAHPDTGKLLFLANNIYLQKDTYVKTKTVYCIPRFLLGGEYLDKQRGQPIQLCLESLNMVFNQALGVDTGYYGDDNGYHDDITAFQQPQQFQLNPWAYEFVPNAAFTAVLQPQFTPVEAYEPALSYPSKPLWSTIAAAGLAI